MSSLSVTITGTILDYKRDSYVHTLTVHTCTYKGDPQLRTPYDLPKTYLGFQPKAGYSFSLWDPIYRLPKTFLSCHPGFASVRLAARGFKVFSGFRGFRGLGRSGAYGCGVWGVGTT